jgi:hypothetical protein
MNTQLISVPFHGQSLLATLVNDVPHVAMKPICENIGIDWKSQHRKITTHPVLKSTMVMVTTVAEDGKLRDMLMLPVKFLNGWLFGIDSNRVKPEIQECLISYQTECFEVLANHFMPKVNETVANGQTFDFLKPITEPLTVADFEWRYQVISNALTNLKNAQIIISVSGAEWLVGKCFEK